MRRAYRMLTALCIAGVALGCPGKSTGPDGGRGRARSVDTDEVARIAFAYLKSVAEYVDGQVPANFSSPLSISGATGSVSVAGRKTSSSSSSASSSSSTSTSDLALAFANYDWGGSGATVTGTVSWYDYYYSRVACSGSYCASASDNSEAMEGQSIQITFEYDDVTYSDEIDVDASSDRDSSSWDVTVTNRAGQQFSFVW